MLIWRVHIFSRAEEPVYLDQVTMLHTGTPGPKRPRLSQPLMELFEGPDELEKTGGLGFEASTSDIACYTNGWQAWNYAGSLGLEDSFPRTRLGPFTKPMRVNKGTPVPRRKGLVASDMFAVIGDRVTSRGIVAGFLSQEQAFGSFEAWLRPTNPAIRMWANLDEVQLDPGGSFKTDWACLMWVDLNDAEPYSDYLEIVAYENSARREHQTPVGWCSWYHAFEDISQEHIERNLEWVQANEAQIPLQVIQIDDGYEENVGDWFNVKDTFPDGIASLSTSIRDSGFTPGIWIAPFLAKRKSEIGKKNKDWILRNQINLPVSPGFIWDSFPYVFDVTHPGVLDHLRKVIHRIVHEMGFKYLKLDFLFAGALPGKHFNPRVTRAQSLSRALRVIREAAGEETTLLGCGCPLGSGIGVFDMMRINPDVSPRWNPEYWGVEAFLEQEEGHPATRNAIVTAVNRFPLHRRWWVNDPDCLLIRSTDTNLTEEEVRTLATVVSMSGGSMFVSDDLPALTDERISWLNRIIPPLPRAAIVRDWFDSPRPSKLVMPLQGVTGSWNLIAVLNWHDQAADSKVDLNEMGMQIADSYHVVDFWQQDYRSVTGHEIDFRAIPPHGSRLVAVRIKSDSPLWVGDTLHVSQGLVIKEWEVGLSGINAVLDLGRQAEGKAWIQIPSDPKSIMLNSSPLDWKAVAQNIYCIQLEFSEKANLAIQWTE
ncbi:MAG: hypothetical protein GTO18_01170 [Anaerolineales bacterium]|nr:hypothetical protein [Anaerolineales bacterium]